MTVQRRTLIEPRDIVAPEYECTHCGSRYLVPLKSFDRRVDRCPNCQEKWLAGDPEADLPSGDQAVSLFVGFLRQFQTRNLGVTVRLELAVPSAMRWRATSR